MILDGDRCIDTICSGGRPEKWAAKHDYEKLKEGAWLEPALAFNAQENEGRLE